MTAKLERTRGDLCLVLVFNVVLNVLPSLIVILLSKTELVALLFLCSSFPVAVGVLRLFLVVTWVDCGTPVQTRLFLIESIVRTTLI